MKLSKEQRDNITKLSALCSIQTLMFGGCKADIIAMNTHQLKQNFKYDTLSKPNKKVVDKKIAEAVKNLNQTIDLVIKVNARIETSMRNTLGDEVVDALIDEIDLALDKVELDKYLKL